MADEIQKPFLDKVSDGLSTLGTSISNGVSSFMDKRAQGQEDLANLSDADRASVIAGDNSPLYKQQNFASTMANMNAQNPTPINDQVGIPSVSQAATFNPNDMLLNAGALQNQGPLNPIQQDVFLGGPQYAPIDPNLQGTGQSIANPATPSQPAAPETSQTVSNQSSRFANPFGGSDSLAMKGINQAEQAGQLKAVAEHAYYQKKADTEQESMDKQQKLQETFEFNYQQKMDDYTQSIKDFRALAGDKVVPGAFLARQDTQGSLMTGLAIALGGIGGALQGTNKNIGLEMIEKAIDKDVAAQQFNMDYKYKVGKANVDDQASMLSKMREKFGDDKSAILATKLGMLSMVEDKMNAQLTAKGGARDLAVSSQANSAKAQIMQRREQMEMQLRASQAQQFEKQQMMQGLDPDNLSNEQALALYGKDADKYVRGYGMSTDPQLAKDFIQKVKPMGDTVRKLKDTITQVDKLNKWNFNDRQALESIMTDLQLTLKDEENYKLGVLTGPDMDLLQKITGDPTSLSPIVNTKVRLQQALKNIENKMNNKIENYGFDPKKRKGNVDSLVKKN